MKWIAISGSWRKMNKKLEDDIRASIRKIFAMGNGIVSGGALGVDYVATGEALKLNPTADKIKIFIPTTLEVFAAHYRKRAKERVIKKKQAEILIEQLTKIKKINTASIIENEDNKILDKETYYERNSAIIEAADELLSFHVNQSLGTKDAIVKAHEKGIPVKVFTYIIE